LDDIKKKLLAFAFAIVLLGLIAGVYYVFHAQFHGAALAGPTVMGLWLLEVIAVGTLFLSTSLSHITKAYRDVVQVHREDKAHEPLTFRLVGAALALLFGSAVVVGAAHAMFPAGPANPIAPLSGNAQSSPANPPSHPHP
jgi:hypothetical protein